MTRHKLFYATNRGHEGADRWNPAGYGSKFSHDGRENLRFGKLELSADDRVIRQYLREEVGSLGVGDGEGLAKYLSDKAGGATINAFKENLKGSVPDEKQSMANFGSQGFFNELKNEMIKKTDVLVFIHGYNVSWKEAVGSALALQLMLNNKLPQRLAQEVVVVLFTWPSDGSMFPFRAYKSDRADARDSGFAVGRAILKLRDFMVQLREDARNGSDRLCEQEIHLLCHSMGNFVLQNALARIGDFVPGPVLPRILDHVFLCSPDVDDTVLERGQPMERLDELAHSVSVYYNRGDKALLISDLTKANPERLGTNGAAHPFDLHNKIHQIDCSDIVHGVAEHSYFLAGHVNRDVRLSISGVAHDSKSRNRASTGELPNVWKMK